MRHLPLLRAGEPYRSKDTVVLRNVVGGEPVAEVGQANRGLIAKDLAAAPAARRVLGRRTVAELLDVCRRAASLFAEGDLTLDPFSGETQSPDDYVRQLSSTTGMPQALCRLNMEKVRFVLAEMEQVLGGLTRGLDLRVLDRGFIEQDGRTVAYVPQADVLGAVLPSNSPGVHSLWLPAIPLKIPLALKPGREEPWTPLRVCQALIEAGCPRQALHYYPAERSAGAEILLRSGRSMLFGDASTVGGFKDDPRVQLHGPGWSKVLIGPDAAPRWREHLDVLVGSVADNGGRSCLNASGVWTPGHGREIAEGLADRLASIEARSLDDPEARLAAFANRDVARRIAETIEDRLEIPGAIDLTALRRGHGPYVERDGLAFLLPTVVWCEQADHPLTGFELLFPFVTVVEAPADQICARIGATLVGTVLSDDPSFVRQALEARNIDRINLGPIPTGRVSWDQPHEGNLFEHLYHQRAFQAAAGAAG